MDRGGTGRTAPGALLEAAGASALSWATLSGLQWLLLAIEGPRLPAGPAATAAAVSTALLLPAILLSIPVVALAGAGRRRWAGAGLVALAACGMNVRAFERGFATVPLAMAVAAFAVAGAASVRRRPFPLLFAVASLPAAGALVAIDRHLYPARYLAQHASLELVAAWWMALWWAQARAVRPRAVSAAGRIALAIAVVAGALFPLAWMGRVDLAARGALVLDLPLSGLVNRVLAPLNDRDGDGFGTLLTRTDCDDGDPAVHPAALEIPGNGIDDNCVGGDATASPGTPPGTTRAPPARTPVPRILLVTIDALRADRVFGPDAAAVMPNLAARLPACRRFTRAYSAFGSTLPSVFSLFHSLYPGQATGRVPCGHFEVPVAPDRTTVARELGRAGYATRAFVGAWLLRPSCGGPARDFDESVVEPIELYDPTPWADRQTDRALPALSADGKWFVWVHYYDPHDPRPAATDPGIPGATEAWRQYNQEVRFVDRHLDRLLRQLPPDAVVLIAADHGEELGVAGSGHLGLSEDSLHVPLLLCGPGIRPGTVDVPVGLVDAGPTILDLAGLPPLPHARGESLCGGTPDCDAVPARGWAAAEYLRDGTDRVVQRAVIGPDWRVDADVLQALYRVDEGGRERRSASPVPGTPATDAYIDFCENGLAALASPAP